MSIHMLCDFKLCGANLMMVSKMAQNPSQKDKQPIGHLNLHTEMA